MGKIIELKMLDSAHTEEEETLRSLRKEIVEMAPVSHILVRDQSDSKSTTHRSYINQNSQLSTSERFTDTADTSRLYIPESRESGRTGSQIVVESPRRPKRTPGGGSSRLPISEISGVSIEMNGTPTVGEESPEDYNDSR